MSEKNPVRLAVIGAGAMGRNHIRFVTEEPEAVLVGQHRRHNPFVQKAKQIIEGSELGRLTVSSFHYMIYKNDEYFDVE